LPAMSRGRTLARVFLAYIAVMACLAWPGNKSSLRAWNRHPV
jgi:hypothetical protein